jgi:Tfp pilus assembly protein PilN
LRVKLDLRPENIKNVPPPKTRKIGLLMLCIFIIFGAVISFAGIDMIRKIYDLEYNIKDRSARVGNLQNIRRALQADLTRLAAQESVYRSSLSIMQQELPTIEVFDSIDKSIVRGVILNSLTLSQKELKVGGVANTEDNVVNSTRNLLDSGAFSVAQVPVVTRANMGPEGLRFSLSLEPLSIGESGKN